MTDLQDERFSKASFPFWLMVGFLIIIFFTGGSARADVQSLIILRPVAVFIFAISVWMLKWTDIRDNCALSILAILATILMWLHALPIFGSTFAILPHHELLWKISTKTATVEGLWPTTISSLSTSNSNYSLFVPLALLALGIQLNQTERWYLLPVLLGLGLLTGIWGLLQAIGDAQGTLYLYRITNYGSAVGMFANRNHQAILLACLFPMLAVFASWGVRSNRLSTPLKGLTFVTGLVLVPLILVTGSRAGLIFGVVGLMFALFLYRRSTKQAFSRLGKMNFNPVYIFIPFGVLSLVFITILTARAQAFERLMAGDTGISRSDIWQPAFELVAKNFPFGVGPGSFTYALQAVEPTPALTFLYVNQVHNDWLDVLVTLGLLGALLLAAFLTVAGRHAYYAFFKNSSMSRHVALARLGSCLILLLLLGSIWDYPLRTPIGASLFVAALIWQSGKRAATGDNAGDE